MAIKIYRPTTPGRRGASVVDFSVLKKSERKSPKKLKKRIKAKAGRSLKGRITVRHRGGGYRKIYRRVDFKREKFDIPAKIGSIEYDPNRTAFIAGVSYEDGEKRYVLAWEGAKVGDQIISSKKKVEPKPGNRMPLSKIPSGTFVYNIELVPGRGGKIIRSAGNYAVLQAKEDGMAQIEMPSREVRLVPEISLATVGQVSNVDYGSIRIGKAGRRRLMGIRPTVRGKAMNPVDHPHGGGEGGSPVGLKHPKTPWGKPALGVKTRKKNKYSDRFIIKRRK